jgi:hypothetical protein
MREFTVGSGNATVAGATSLVCLHAPAAPGVNIEMLRYWVGQSANATSAQQRIQLGNGSAVPTMVAATPIKQKEHDAVSILVGSTTGAAATAGVNASAEPASFANVETDAFNVLNGWLRIDTPAETKIQPAGAVSGYYMTFTVAPSTLTGWSFGVRYREV